MPQKQPPARIAVSVFAMCEPPVTKNTAEWSEKLALSWSGRLGSNQLRGPWTWAKLEDIELAAGPVPAEKSMEARVARIESDVAHMRTDIADIKVDLRAVRDKLDSTAERLYIALAGTLLGVMARGFGWI
jgi:hypothetical protein